MPELALRMNTNFDEQYELIFRLGDFSSDGAKLFIEYSDEQGLTIKIDFLSVSFGLHRRKRIRRHIYWRDVNLPLG